MTPYLITPNSNFIPEGFYADVPDGLFTGFATFEQARAFAEQNNGTATEARNGRTVKIFICRPGIKLQTEDAPPTQIWPHSMAQKKFPKIF